MSETPTGWRDRQGLNRSERQKESRRLALRARFAAITRLYERALSQRKLERLLSPDREHPTTLPVQSPSTRLISESLLAPALLGIGAGVASYFIFFAAL